jgi:hypothetical protein
MEKYAGYYKVIKEPVKGIPLVKKGQEGFTAA